ncbi:unnamed protein product [Cuscuta epithymum]|uniref:Transposase MuDR plant domain-containing protein n=1 Tax=Cuscuta epithymum TaxID=186058 RepID=A0AAV0BY72_9ASTE|nr:unnamed protein product [Cuscuta epithymum]
MEVSHFIEEIEGSEENKFETVQREDICSGGSSSDEEWIGNRKKLSCYNSNMLAKNQFDGFEPFYDSDNSENYLLTPTRSEDGGESGVKKESVTYKVDNDATLKMLVWKVGMKFASPEIFKKQVVRYAVIEGYSIRFSLCAKNRSRHPTSPRMCLFRC